MTENERPTPFFIADNRALDFLNSVASPWGSEIEWIGDGQDWLAWLEHAGLVPTSVLKRFRKEALQEELDAAAAQARELREWFRNFVSAHAGQSINPSALSKLNKINKFLAQDSSYRQIEACNESEKDVSENGKSFRWKRERRWQSLNDLLLPIAEGMGDLVCLVDFERVKYCESPTCTLWFYDVSHNRSRRWCSMAVCGNRAKAAAHRAKKRSDHSEPKKRN